MFPNPTIFILMIIIGRLVYHRPVKSLLEESLIVALLFVINTIQFALIHIMFGVDFETLTIP
jgi:hypothetical protein